MILSTLALSLILFAQQDPGQWLYKDFFHLGNDECPEWTEASLLPDGTAFEIDFNAK